MIPLLLTLALTGCSSSNDQPAEPQPAAVQKTPPPTPRPSPAAVAEADAEPAEDVEEPGEEAEEVPEVEMPEEEPAQEAATQDVEPAAEVVKPAPEEPAVVEPAVEEPEEIVQEEPEPEPAGATTYTLNASQGLLWAQVFKDTTTVAAGLSHDHVIAAYGWSGTATWDPDNPSECNLSITLPVSGLDPDAPNLRKSFGLEGELSESQREEVKGHMLGKSQLNSSKYANITFKSTSCSGSGTSVSVTGDMAIHGKKRSITVPLTVSADGSAFSAQGSFNIKATDFGFEPYSAMLGALKNKNQMTIGVNIVGAAS